MNQKIDYLIIGLGLAGSTLALELLRRGKSVLVLDQPELNQASSVAAGLFNPITGKYLTKTWNADTLFPFFKNFYTEVEKELGAKFFRLTPIYRPFLSQEEKNLWKQKYNAGEINPYLLQVHDTPVFENQVRNPLGGIEIAHTGTLQVKTWLNTIRNYLLARQSYQEEFFDEKVLSQEPLQYQGREVGKIIFCNGLHASQSTWWKYLPVIPLKGEVLTVKMETRMDRIYNRAVYIVPGMNENTYVVGATYERMPFEDGVTITAREELQGRLRELTPCAFEFLHQEWGIRPTTPDRRPLLGAHPKNKNLIVFNGLGTKGVSLAPYFAHHLSDWLEGRNDLSPEVNINRFKALYSG